MTSESLETAKGGHIVATLGRILGGVAIGAVAFGVVSLLSLWAEIDASAAALVLVIAAAFTLLWLLLIVDTVLAWGIAGTLLALFLIGFAIGFESSVVGSVNPAPSTLLRHGGHSAAVAVVVGVSIAGALRSTRSVKDRSQGT